MTKRIFIGLSLLLGFSPVFGQRPDAETKNEMDRIELCKQNYTALFGGEALNGLGSDPEIMDILQKYIFGEVFAVGDLDIRTREMITCISLATLQQLPQLKGHVGAALNVGVTPVELREAIYQCATNIGFPRVLNALSAINEVFAERGITLPLAPQQTTTEETRREKGSAIQQPLYGERMKELLKDVPGGMGAEAARFLTEVHFGDFQTRSGLDTKTRELLTFCVMTVLGAEPQLRSHLQANLKAGNSRETLTAAVIQCMPYIGFPPALNALNAIKESEQSAPEQNMVRVSRITVDPARLAEYNSCLKEGIEAAMRTEPGVLTLYAVAEKERPNELTILEIYADEAAYKSHIRTPHFQKYKQGTLDMVQYLELIDATPLLPGLKIK